MSCGNHRPGSDASEAQKRPLAAVAQLGQNVRKADTPSAICVRKQYFFWPSERGLLAWDVDRLIELSRDLDRQRVPLSEIRELDEPHWYSHEGDVPTCRSILEHVRLIHYVDRRFPIILNAEGRVMDGMHRVARAVLEGLDSIQAVRFPRTPEPDFVGVDPKDLPYDDDWPRA